MATNAQNLALLGGNVDASGEVDANTLDGLDSLQFLRSDTDDTMNGQLTIRQAEGSGNAGGLILQESSNQMHRFWVDNQYQYNQIGSSAGTWIWTNSNGEQARLTESGNLFIGGNTDASPYNNTTGEGIVLGSGHMWAAADSESVLDLNRMGTTPNGNIINLYQNGTSRAALGVNSTDNFYVTATSGGGAGLLMWGAGSTVPTISPLKEGAGVDGELNLGRSTERFNDIHLAGTVYTGTVSATGDIISTGTIEVEQSLDASGNDRTLFRLDTPGSWSLAGNAGTTSDVEWSNSGDPSNIMGKIGLRYGGTATQAQSEFVIKDMYQSGYGNSGDVMYIGSNKIIGIPGSLGIGTTTPGAKLHVDNVIQSNDSVDYPVIISQSDPSNSLNQVGGSGVGILFKAATNSTAEIGASIAAVKPGGSDDDTTTDLAFYVSQNDTTLDEAVRISNTGRVGIGTASPVSPLSVYGEYADIALMSNATTDRRTGGINWYNTNASDTVASIQCDRSGANDAGDITFDTQPAGGGNTERMRIKSNGNVGIGVTNPDTPLVVANGMKTVVSDSGIHNAVRMDNSYATGTTAGAAITWQQGGNIKSSIEANTYGSDYMSFKVTGNVERMKIDGAGRVTTPYQPHFRLSNSQTGPSSVVHFNEVHTNIGGHWNNTTDRFTAPVAGVYQFNFATLHQTAGSNTYYARTNFIINGVITNKEKYGDTLEDWNGSFISTTLSLAIYLQAGDYIQVYNEGIQLYQGGGNYTAFSGYLVG